MTGVDLTLALTAHNETWVAGPTMESAAQAIARVEADGFTVQAVVAFDAAGELTRQFFDQAEFARWERWEIDERDPGLTRNRVAERAEGRFLAFLDADDLVSENWLFEGVRRLVRAHDAGERVIAHPELNVIFDGGYQLNQNVDQDSPLFTPHFLYVRNCYDSLCMAPREAYREIPYAARDIPNGLSREDWQFAMETMARGWRHVVVRDTIIFKRRRDFSLMVESAGRGALPRSLPEMYVDRVRDLPRSP
ncbi:MAG: glycosyltransferase family A protein [Nocardioidaceae bacterium]